MPWCPNCKTEYREGFYHCSDCGAELVDEIETGDITETSAEQVVDWEFLDVFTDEQEADMIVSFLNTENILTWKKYPGFSDITKIVGGMTRLGVEIYVPKDRLDDARAILKDILGRDTEEQQVDVHSEIFTEESNENQDISWQRMIIVGLLIAFLYLFFSK